MSLLEQDISKKRQVDKKVTELEFETGKSKKYKVEAIWVSAVYSNEVEGHLPGLYYLLVWKRYAEKENIWELLSTIKYLKKLINSFYKKYSEKPTITSQLIDSVPPMAKATIKPTKLTTKWKQGQLANNANKWAKNWVLDTCDIWTILLLISQQTNKKLSFKCLWHLNNSLVIAEISKKLSF